MTAREVIAGAIWKWCEYENLEEATDSILSALKEAGYIVVPKEPTEEMKNAGAWAATNWRGLGLSQALHIWNEMISATQPASEQKEPRSEASKASED